MAPSPRDLDMHPLPSFTTADGTRWSHTRGRGWTGDRTEWIMVTNNGPLAIWPNAEHGREMRERPSRAMMQLHAEVDPTPANYTNNTEELDNFMDNLLTVTDDLRRNARQGWREVVDDAVAATTYGDREATEDLVAGEHSSESDSGPPPIALASDSSSSDSDEDQRSSSDSDEDQRSLPNWHRPSPRQRQRERAMTRMRMAFAQAREIIQQSRIERGEPLSPRTLQREMNDPLEQADAFLRTAPEAVPPPPPPSDAVEEAEIDISSLSDLVAIQEHWMHSIDSISNPTRMFTLCKVHLRNQVDRLESLMARELISEGDYLLWMNQFKLVYDATTARRRSY